MLNPNSSARHRTSRDGQRWTRFRSWFLDRTERLPKQWDMELGWWKSIDWGVRLNYVVIFSQLSKKKKNPKREGHQPDWKLRLRLCRVSLVSVHYLLQVLAGWWTGYRQWQVMWRCVHRNKLLQSLERQQLWECQSEVDLWKSPECVEVNACCSNSSFSNV